MKDKLLDKDIITSSTINNNILRKGTWKQICDEYAQEFANKHNIDIEYDLKNNYLWIGGNPGTICEMADMFIDMDQIRYDIDNDIPEDYFEKWYWKSLEYYEMGLTYMNYESFCKGCPEPHTEEELNKIRESQRRVQEAKKELTKCIQEVGLNPFI